MDEELDAGGDLLPDRAHRQLDPGHEDHRLQAGERIPGRVGVDRGDRAVVAGVHRLEHVQRLAATNLADHDPVGTHAQRVAHQVADGDLAAALDVRRSVLHPHHVGLAESELGGVLDRDDPLGDRDEAREHVQGGGLAGSGPTGDEDVGAALDAGGQERRDPGRPGAVADQSPDVTESVGELPDRQHRAVERDRGDHGVDTGSVGQAGVDVRLRLVDAATDLGHDLLDDAPQVALVEEADVGVLEPAGTLDEDRRRARCT
jgi:hypothetical protein